MGSRIGGAARVWCFTGVLAVVTAVGLLTAARSMTHPLDGVSVAWWMLAAGFAVAEVFVLYARVGREAHAFSLSEVPLVIGLVFCAPVTIVGAQVLGLGAVLIVRREQPLRGAFQVAQRAVATLVAVFVFVPIIRVAGSSWPAIWLAAFAATLVADVMARVLGSAAEALSEGSRMRFDEVVGIGTALTFAKTGVALVAVMVLMQYPPGLVLVTIPAAAILLAGRAYVQVRRRHDDIVLMQRAGLLAQRSLNPDEMLPLLLGHLRDVFRSDIAELAMPDETGGRHVVSRVGPGEATSVLVPAVLDPTRGVWARVAAEQEGVLLERPIRNPVLAEHFASVGISDAIVAPVTFEAGSVAVLTVANRVGDLSTFGAEDLRLLQALAREIGVPIENALSMKRVETTLARETETNQLKDDFLATISHELRSPLTSIQGYVKTMLGAGTGMSDKERREFLTGADRAGERLRSLIEDLLFTSRVETSVASNRLGPVGLAGLVERVVQDRAGSVAPNRIVLRFPSSVSPVWTSEDDVRRIVSNLLDNALKYSPTDTPVTVSASADGDGVRISFQDRGAGIPESERDRIFDRFYQVDHGSTRSNGGVGLGLHICRRTAESLGGRVWLDRSDGSGSVFCLWLPARDVVSVDDADERRHPRVGAFVSPSDT